jgi:hypothetical protein
VLAQLRFDYTNKQLGKCKLFGPRADSQDTWIWHSNYNLHNDVKIFNFIFGKPGCDNKLIYLFNILGFEVFNQPYFVKTYHIQQSQQRDYGKDMLPHPYMIVSPFITNRLTTSTKIWGTVGWRLENNHKISIEAQTHNFSRFMFKNDNETLGSYLKTKFANDDTFVIPKTDKNGIILTSIILMLNNVTQGTFFQTGQVTPEYQSNIQAKHFWNILLSLVQGVPQLGLQHTGDLIAFSHAYMDSFNKSDICMGFTTWDPKYRELMTENKSDFYKSIFEILKHKQWVSSTVLNIFNHLHNDPWIGQLNNQKLLIISPHTKKIEQQINTVKLKKLYGFDIFANCEFCFINFTTWCTNTQTQIVDKLGEFDIALCEGGIFGPIVTNYIYGIGKSAIDIGDILPLYFGLWTNSNMKSHKEIIQLYLNSFWKKL